LIGTASGKDPSQIWDQPAGSLRIFKAGSMLDWIIQAVYHDPSASCLHLFDQEFSTGLQGIDAENFEQYTTSTGFPQEQSPWGIHVWTDSLSGGVEKKEDIHMQITRLLGFKEQNAAKEIKERLVPKQNGFLARMPLKTSVTSLCKQNLLPGFSPESSEETPLSKAKPEEMVLPLRLSPLPSRPVFLSTKADSPADLGTATHRALGCLPLLPLKDKKDANLHSSLQDGLEYLSQKGMLSPAQRKGLYVSWLYSFFESSWGQRLLVSSRVQREWAFNYRLNKEPVTLVQGVIDCCFLEDGAWVLIDYKTDYVQEEKAVVLRYGPQLALYKKALEEITGIPVKETVIFLLRSGRGLLLA
jgi:hypothetical protein